MIKEVNGLSELNEVINNNKKVLVDIWAPWCGPCKMLSPLVDQVSNEVSDLTVVKVNIDDNEEVALRYDVEAIPTLLIFDSGKLLNKNVGFVSKDKILNMVK